MAKMTCQSCGALVELSPDLPCPSCGDTHRVIEIEVEERIRIVDKIKMQQFEPGRNDWVEQLEFGEEHFRAANEIRTVNRRYNRRDKNAPNSYFERIIKTDTGELVKHVSEPLADHASHGSAKHACPDFPHEWLAVSAYFIWESEGKPSGRSVNHWNRARNELKKLWKAGKLPVPVFANDQNPRSHYTES